MSESYFEYIYLVSISMDTMLNDTISPLGAYDLLINALRRAAEIRDSCLDHSFTIVEQSLNLGSNSEMPYECVMEFPVTHDKAIIRIVAVKKNVELLSVNAILGFNS